MNTPSGTTIIFDGGSFTGVLPSVCQFKNNVVVIGTGTNCTVTFNSGVIFNETTSLSLNNCAITATNFILNGSLFVAGLNVFEINKITGTGSLTVNKLSVLSDCEIDNLAATESVDVYGRSTGNTWNVSLLNSYGSLNVSNLTATTVAAYSDSYGSIWDIGTITSNNVVNAKYINVSGLFDAVPGDETLIGFVDNGKIKLSASKILASSLNTGNFTKVSYQMSVLTKHNSTVDLGNSLESEIDSDDVLNIDTSLAYKDKASVYFKYSFN